MDDTNWVNQLLGNYNFDQPGEMERYMADTQAKAAQTPPPASTQTLEQQMAAFKPSQWATDHGLGEMEKLINFGQPLPPEFLSHLEANSSAPSGDPKDMWNDFVRRNEYNPSSNPLSKIAQVAGATMGFGVGGVTGADIGSKIAGGDSPRDINLGRDLTADAAGLGAGVGLSAALPSIGSAIGGDALAGTDVLGGVEGMGGVGSGATGVAGVDAINSIAPGAITKGLSDAEIANSVFAPAAAASATGAAAGSLAGTAASNATIPAATSTAVPAASNAAIPAATSAAVPAVANAVTPPPAPAPAPTDFMNTTPGMGNIPDPNGAVNPNTVGGGGTLGNTIGGAIGGVAGTTVGNAVGNTVDKTIGAVTGGTDLSKYLPALIGGLVGATNNQPAPIQQTPWNSQFFGPLQDKATSLMNTNQLQLPEVPQMQGIPNTATDQYAKQYADSVVGDMNQSFTDPDGPLAAIRSDFTSDQPGGGTRQSLAEGIAAGRQAKATDLARASIMNSIYPTNLNYNAARVQQDNANNQWNFGQNTGRNTALFNAPWQNLTQAGNIFTGAAGKGQTTVLPETPWWQTGLGGALATQGLFDKISKS